MSARLLVVEDDPKLAVLLSRGLQHEGYAITLADTGPEGLEQASTGDFDAVVLDLLLPGLDGFAVCEGLRGRGHRVPVLMLTALSDVSDRIRGLDGGADDYLVKPFDFGELLARLRVLVRRGPVPHPSPVVVGGLRIDPTTRVVSRDGRQVELTQREFDVFALLLEHRGRLVSRAQLRETIWRDDPNPSANLADMYIGYLRRKLETPQQPALIRTVRGRGFLLEDPV